MPIRGDNPIQVSGDDVLERAAVADAFARQVLWLDASQGAAVGVFGPWGSGKTSFINLARPTFQKAEVPVFDFNPWMFSGAEQLVERFFLELSAELKVHDLKSLGDALFEYGGALSGTAGATVKIAGVFVRRRGRGTSGLHQRVASVLRRRDKPIVIVLDDVDRLSASEIREVFKLIRLTASFPMLIYIVACDRLRVEQALSEEGLSGRDYIEKIFQWPFNLPQVPEHLLAALFPGEIETALADIENRPPFDPAWPDIYSELVLPLIRNMRDVRRYALAIRETVSALGDRVAIADILGLEAIRVFLPDVFMLMPGAIDSLTGAAQPVERRHDALTQHDPVAVFNNRLKTQIDELITATGNGRDAEAARIAREVVEAMIERLFPAAAKLRKMADGGQGSPADGDLDEHLRGHRVAHGQILRLYLERFAGPDLLAFHDAERAVGRMPDRNDMDAFMRSLDPTRWQDVVANIPNLVDQLMRPEDVQSGIIVLLNLWPDMPERTGADFLNDTRTTVRHATYRLMQRLDDIGSVETAVRRILPELSSLSSKLELALQVGHRKASGHKLVSESTALEFESMLQKEIRTASADDLADEREPSRLLVFAKHYAQPSEEPIDIDTSPKLTFALLRAVRGTQVTESLESRAVHSSSILDWNCLIDLYGGEETLEARLTEMRAHFSVLKPWIVRRGLSLDDAEDLLELATKYLAS